MHDTVSRQGKASPGFVEQVETYVQRCLTGLQAKEESQGGGADPTGPGRPLKLPSVALWSGLVICVLNRVGGVRGVWRQGYDSCDQTLYDRLDQEGTACLEQLFVPISAMLAAWLQPLLEKQSWYPLAPFASDVLVLDETTLDPVARKLPI